MTTPDDMNAILRALDGQTIPGGCGHCNAVQEIHADAYGPGAHSATIKHDTWCRWWRANTAEGRQFADQHPGE